MVKCLSTFRGNGEKIFFHIFFCKNEKYLYGKNQKGNQGNVEKLRRKRSEMEYKSFIFEVRSRYRISIHAPLAGSDCGSGKADVK